MHCGMEKWPAWGTRSRRGRTVWLPSHLSSRLLRPRHWCSLGWRMGGGRRWPSARIRRPSLADEPRGWELFYSLPRGRLSYGLVGKLVLFETPTGFAVFKVLNEGKITRSSRIYGRSSPRRTR